jgi:hypothetical protein
MVPVPEELVGEVGAFAMAVRMRSVLPFWDEASAAEHLALLDDDERAVLGVVVRAALANDHLDAPGLASRLGTGEREALGLIRQVNRPRLDPPRGDIVHVKGAEQELYVVDVVAEAFEAAGATAPVRRTSG